MSQKIIEQAWENRELLKDTSIQAVINEVIEQLDKGKLRVAEPLSPSVKWKP
jgi:2,3,4,5-tetrahydropyridine-2-carboxylate N-succinyltransferase